MKHTFNYLISLSVLAVLLTAGAGVASAQETPDSIPGFNEQQVRQMAIDAGIPLSDIEGYMQYKKQEFLGKQNGTWEQPFSPAQPMQAGQSCTNGDFEDGTTNGWDGSTGTFGSCCPSSGFVSGRHTIVDSGNDAYGGFPKVAPGGSYSFMLGNNINGTQAERIMQTFAVTEDNKTFTYKYAVVLEDPNHQPQQQPYFRIKMLDAADNIIPCSEFTVTAGQGIPGFTSIPASGVIYKPWTSNTVDLSDYIGEDVTIIFETADCSLGGHFGYAYIDGSCQEYQIESCGTFFAGDPVYFTNNSAGNATGETYSWNFGDGGTSTLANPTHTYTYQGNYTVTLTISGGGQSCTRILTDEIVITRTRTDVIKAEGTFCKGTNVCFSNTLPNSDENKAYSWAFGDTQTSAQKEPEHSYANAGTYTVTLTISSLTQPSCVNTFTYQVTIIDCGEVIKAEGTFCEDQPTCFYPNPPVTTNPYTYESQPRIYYYRWDFGDGNTSEERFPRHVYATQGSYIVTLQISPYPDYSCLSTFTDTVTIGSCEPAISSSGTYCAGKQVCFTTTVSGNFTYTWNFGDGATSIEKFPVHSYAAAGQYIVTLHVSRSEPGQPELCSATFRDTLEITDCEGILSRGFPCNGNTICFSTDVTGDYAYNWTFGDGGTATTAEAKHAFKEAGTYIIKLKVSPANNPSCYSIFTDTLIINHCPFIIIADSTYCNQDSVRYHTDYALEPTQVGVWDFGDGTISYLANPVHQYTSPGIFPVSFTIIDSSDTKKITATGDTIYSQTPVAEDCAVLIFRDTVVVLSCDDSVNCANCLSSFSPVPGKKYMLSAWVKENSSTSLDTYSNPSISFEFKGSSAKLGPFKASGRIIDGWQRIYAEFIIPMNAFEVIVKLNNAGKQPAYFDDIRIHPFDANMKSFVYDPVSLRLMAELDENNYATFYEYDEEGALIRVKKETEKGIMTIKETRSSTVKKFNQ